VHEADPGDALNAALRAPDALTRATAARVAGVRDVKAALPALRDGLAGESDPNALREQLRTLALIGGAADVDLAIAVAAKQAAVFDAVVTDAVARRGGKEAIDLYMAKTHALRSIGETFERALWGHPELIGETAGRLVAADDARGFDGLLDALFEAGFMLPAERTIAALSAPSEDIRQQTAWYLVRGYAADPAKINERLRPVLLAERTEEGSNREDFARELLRRMLGREPSGTKRWLDWLATEEADRTLPKRETELYEYLTADEYRLREARCKNLAVACPITLPKRGERKIRSTPVAKAAFTLPGTLPAGLGDALAGKCDWLGVADATVDRAGRVQSVNLKNVQTACKDALETILKLSYGTNRTIASDTTTSNILVVKAPKASVCLDEDLADVSAPRSVGGEVTAPLIKKRVEPRFPESARQAMGGNTSVLVIAESVISRTGCVRSVNLLAQSPFPALNGAAVMALSQWTFEAGRLDGKPVDVVFNLTVNFKVSH
jgi:hypothetical protein